MAESPELNPRVSRGTPSAVPDPLFVDDRFEWSGVAEGVERGEAVAALSGLWLNSGMEIAEPARRLDGIRDIALDDAGD